MKKDFKPGDKVTVIIAGDILLKGVVNGVFDGGATVRVGYDGGRFGKFHRDYCYHGHNVKVEITGEELPERLRMERVFLDTSLVKFLTPFCNGRQQCFIEMPAHIARQYREWMEENK
jgi:hypothetical protein